MGSKNSQGQSIALAIVALLAGVLIGIVGASAFNLEDQAVTNTDSVDTTDVSDAESDLRVTLNRLLTEHVDLAAPALRNAFDGSDDTEASVAALDENSVELAAAIGSVYGEDAEESFLELWRQHIGFFTDYVVAAKEGDQAGMEQAEKDLAGYVDQSSTFLSEATGIPEEELTESLNEHVDQVVNVANSYAGGNYEESYREQREATHHMGATADALSGAIADKFPEKF